MMILWEVIVNSLKEKLSGPGFQTFLSCAKPLSFQDLILTLEVPNSFSKEWIKEKCEPILKQKFKQTDYQDIVFLYQVSETKETRFGRLDSGIGNFKRNDRVCRATYTAAALP